MIPISRKQAQQQNLPRYYTGKPCKNGHLAERKTVNGTCFKCANGIDKKYRDDNLDYLAYAKQKQLAAKRNIEWLFDFDTWLEFWEHKIDYKDGTQTGLVMGRFYDCGPYAPENCYITTCRDNFREYLDGDYKYAPREILI